MGEPVEATSQTEANKALMRDYLEGFWNQGEEAVADRTILSTMAECVKLVEDCKPKYVGMCLEFPSRYARARTPHEAIAAVQQVIGLSFTHA